MRCAPPLLLAVIALVSPWPVAADDQLHTHPCSSVPMPEERLACYDAAFGAPRPEAPSTAPSTRRSTDGPASSDQGVAEFGVTPAMQQAREAARERPSVPDSIKATIVAIDVRPNGTHVISLDNGQVWMQTEADRRGRLAAGDPVVIRRAALGSYLLVSQTRGSMRVRRVE